MLLRLLIGLVIFGLVVSFVTSAINEHWLENFVVDLGHDLIGSIFQCDHDTPHAYDEKENIVTCKCKDKEFQDLSYEEFVDVLSFGQKKSLFNADSWGFTENQYHAKLYLTYCGVNADYLNLVSKLPKKLVAQKDTDQIIAGVEKCFSLLGSLTVFTDSYATHLEGKEKLQSQFLDLYKASEDMVNTLDFNTAKKRICADTISKSIGISNSAIVAYKFLDAAENPEDVETACKAFLDTVKDATGYGPDVMSIYFTVMLDTLSYSLDHFFVVYQDYHFSKEVYNAAIENGDGFFTRIDGDWERFGDSAAWESALANTQGTEGVFGLPSLEEAIYAYTEASDLGKQLLSKYIVFRLNKIFSSQLGITYEEFVTYLEPEFASDEAA